MQGTLWMMNSDGNWSGVMPLTEIPEFIPDERDAEDSNKILCDFNKPITVTGTIRSFYMSPRAHKFLICVSRYGVGWKANGQIRLRTLKKALHIVRKMSYVSAEELCKILKVNDRGQ